MALTHPDLEVRLKTEQAKAIIEGKTSVPFKTFVMLVLQRKIIPLFKDWGDEPIVLNSELLTGIASAAQDSQENKNHLIIVTLGVGVLSGVFIFSIGQILFMILGITVTAKELILIAGGILALGLLTTILARVQRGNHAQKVADNMEKIANLLSK